MLFELLKADKPIILPLINHDNCELSVLSVIFDSLPGQVWIDDRETPRCGLVMTPECNLIVGDPSDTQICIDLLTKVGYFGAVTCDTPSWNHVIEKYHENSGIRKYTRLFFSIRQDDLTPRVSDQPPRILRLSDLDQLDYTNKAIVLDWVNIKNRPGLNNTCVAAVTIKNNKIVSCAAVDCIHEERAEIGIKTIECYRRQGYGVASVATLLGALFDQGFQEIGWHCVSSNKGSIAIAEAAGFKQEREYEAYAPFPPIENIDDLSAEEWVDYAKFFEEKATQNPNHYWQAAKCWAKAQEAVSSKVCIKRMIDSNLLWFKDYIVESPEFSAFNDDAEWLSLFKKT